MQVNEKKMLVMDLAVVIILFSVSCIIGKYCMSYTDTWLAFKGPALGTLAIGELIWWRVRKLIMRKGKSNGRNS